MRTSRIAWVAWLAAACLALALGVACNKGGQQGQTGEGAGPQKVEGASSGAGQAASVASMKGLANVPHKGAADPKVVIIEGSDFQ